MGQVIDHNYQWTGGAFWPRRIGKHLPVMTPNLQNCLIPWASPEEWHQANTSLARHLLLHGRRLEGARQAARRQADAIGLLDPVLEALCRDTCARCPAACCRHATVWFDFKDLLFIHLAGLPQPAAQPVAARGKACRYLTGRGCRLPRLQRPFICTWYLCPALKRQRGAKGAGALILAVKDARAAMEAAFLATVGP